MVKKLPAIAVFLCLLSFLSAEGAVNLDIGGDFIPGAAIRFAPRLGLAASCDWMQLLDRHWSFYASLAGNAGFKPLDGLFGYQYLVRAYVSYAARNWTLIPELQSAGELTDSDTFRLPGYTRHLFTLETAFELLGISFKFKPSISWQVDELILACECEGVFQLGDLTTMGIILQADKTLVYQYDNYSLSQTVNFSFYQYEPFLVDLQLSALYNNSSYSLVIFEDAPAAGLFDYWDFTVNTIVATYFGDAIITAYLPVILRLKDHPVIGEDAPGSEPEWQLKLQPDLSLTLYWLLHSAWICDLQLEKIFSNDPAAEKLELKFTISYKLSF